MCDWMAKPATATFLRNVAMTTAAANSRPRPEQEEEEEEDEEEEEEGRGTTRQVDLFNGPNRSKSHPNLTLI